MRRPSSKKISKKKNKALPEFLVVIAPKIASNSGNGKHQEQKGLVGLPTEQAYVVEVEGVEHACPDAQTDVEKEAPQVGDSGENQRIGEAQHQEIPIHIVERRVYAPACVGLRDGIGVHRHHTFSKQKGDFRERNTHLVQGLLD